MGFSAVSPWGSGVSASTFEISTGLYLIVVAMLASTIGGYVAGRLRTKWFGVHTHEVFFRDTAHGFLAWALATVAGAAFLAVAASTIAGGASTGLAASASSSAIQSAATGPVDYYVDALLRSNPAASLNPADSATRREIAGIFMNAPCRLVRPLRVAASPASLECKVTDILHLRDLDAARPTAISSSARSSAFISMRLICKMGCSIPRGPCLSHSAAMATTLRSRRCFR